MTKTADIRYRTEIKANGIVVYTVRSSDDTCDYHVTVFEGKVSGCDCPAYKPCYHMRDVQSREDSREQKSQPKGVVVWTQKPVYCDEVDDPFINAALREQQRKDEERTRLNYYELSIGA